MRRHGMALLLLAMAASIAGCHTTKVYSGRMKGAEPEQSGMQLFTIGGLVPLSDPDGGSCEHGLAWSESQMAPLDVVINLGMAVGGYAAGYSLCDEGDKAVCGSSMATIAPILFSTRTARWACAAAPALPAASTDPVKPTGG